MLDAGATSALRGTRFADVRWYDSVDSTNRELLELATTGAPEGTVVAADHQTAGRGRLDRSWVSFPGCSLLVSVLFRPTIDVERYPLVSATVAVAASDACGDVAGYRPLLKWPNDLVVPSDGPGPDRKLAGILAEAVTSGRSIGALVVGIGLNVSWPGRLPEEFRELAHTAATISEAAGRQVDRRALLVRFLQRLDEHYDVLCRPEGWRSVVDLYRERCSTVGRAVRVELPGGELLEGRATGITDSGRLLVQDNRGIALRAVSVGDVVHLRLR